MPIDCWAAYQDSSEPIPLRTVKPDNISTVAADFSDGALKHIMIECLEDDIGGRVYAIDPSEKFHGGVPREILRRNKLGAIGTWGTFKLAIENERGVKGELVAEHHTDKFDKPGPAEH
mgnify:CR=1 FL=1